MKSKWIALEKRIANLLGMLHVPYSGAKWERGKEDIIGDGILDSRIGQIKGTNKQSITIQYRDWVQLYRHGQDVGKSFPLLVLAFEKPVVSHGRSEIEMPEEILVCITLDDFRHLWQKW